MTMRYRPYPRRWMLGAAAATIAVAVAAGDADFAIAGVTGGFITLAGKGAIKAVGGVLHENKNIDGVAIPASMKAYKAGFTKPEQLKGKPCRRTGGKS